MSVSIKLGTPLAEALNEAVQPKLVDVGWSTGGGDDSALAEYVILMLVNGKTQDQIATELANDLLSLGPEDTEAADFAKWLFEKVHELNNKINGVSAETEQQKQSQVIPSISEQQNSSSLSAGTGDFRDSEMSGDVTNEGQDGNIPTGPKAARNLKQQQQGGRGRIMRQINKTMDRQNDSVLHRVRSHQGSERINSHSRDPPKGPRAFPGRNGRMLPGGLSGPMGMGMGAGMGMGMGMGMGGGPMPNAVPGMVSLSPQQQMQMMAMLEEQARMMAQIIPGMVPPAINPAFQNGPPPGQQGRSLFDRAEINPHRSQHLGPQEHTNGHSSKFHAPSANADVDMNTSHNAPDSSMDVDAAHETQSAEPGPHTVCRFNLKCTRKDCPYAHQSPAAPEGMVVDVNDECPFGAACKNRKCAARHPSPAQKVEHQSEELCRFFPHCTNPNCTFKHPSMPMCRNGADCTVPSCKYTHLQIPCKFKPCLNRMCPFKHAEGQRGVFADKVWRAGDGEKKEHVSERRFVTDGDGQEELIKPETTVADPSADADEAKGHEIVT
ncbi:nuclear polyadenylated RNA-binding protein Nab2 [Histoplasma capsulatum var. duboisii H88]|uniref:Nuclear polyadenylated RNA-binding protein NAB2 n=1 Tax=Ajellomyces capsulatus (strain H88) TaxID=544711 RepID=F0UUI2_AJEC8|nr:nuclear polyadenylated RNA-binding protein Nab2 [Histoplasma capsulatum var. duboisii H88]QSS57610.1 nuclear polyadenylated RNA-binding protein NAB2 [Histoplasma capsulatum var. duboisii H88]